MMCIVRFFAAIFQDHEHMGSTHQRHILYRILTTSNYYKMFILAAQIMMEYGFQKMMTLGFHFFQNSEFWSDG